MAKKKKVTVKKSARKVKPFTPAIEPIAPSISDVNIEIPEDADSKTIKHLETANEGVNREC